MLRKPSTKSHISRGRCPRRKHMTIKRKTARSLRVIRRRLSRLIGCRARTYCAYAGAIVTPSLPYVMNDAGRSRASQICPYLFSICACICVPWQHVGIKLILIGRRRYRLRAKPDALSAHTGPLLVRMRALCTFTVTSHVKPLKWNSKRISQRSMPGGTSSPKWRLSGAVQGQLAWSARAAMVCVFNWKDRSD